MQYFPLLIQQNHTTSLNVSSFDWPPHLRNMKHELNAFDFCLIINGYICIRTCHNKLNCTFNCPWWACPHFTFKFAIVSGVDVLDNQGSSSFNFNSSFVKWRNARIFLDTLTVIKYQFGKFIIYHHTIDNELNLIMWISVVPHQVGITTIVKVAWIRRFLGEIHIHTP